MSLCRQHPTSRLAARRVCSHLPVNARRRECPAVTTAVRVAVRRRRRRLNFVAVVSAFDVVVCAAVGASSQFRRSVVSAAAVASMATIDTAAIDTTATAAVLTEARKRTRRGSRKAWYRRTAQCGERS